MTTNVQDLPAQDNPAKFRSELSVGIETTVAVSQRRDDVVGFTHTLVPETLEGQALADVRAAVRRVVPRRPFAAAHIRHP